MTGRRAARTAAIVAAVLLLVLGVFPVAAGTLAGNALHRQLVDEFPGSMVTVSVEGLSPWGLAGGQVPLVYVGVAGWRVELEGREVEVDSLDIELRDLQVDVGQAISGELDEVEVGRGTFIATISRATLTDLLRQALERERPDLAPIGIDVPGANVEVTLTGPDLQPVTIEFRPLLVEGRIVLMPLGVRDGDPAQPLADAIAGLGPQLPTLPLGLVFDELVISSGGAALRGELFRQTLDLS